MKNNKIYNINFQDILNNDNPVTPDPYIQNRLLEAFALKKNYKKPRENSIISFLIPAFSFQNFGVKAALISCLILISFWIGNNFENNIQPIQADSTCFVVDTFVQDSFSGSASFDTASFR